MTFTLDAQQRLEFTRNISRLEKSREYDEANLRCARIILRDRTRYERECRYLVTWATAVVKRLDQRVESKEAA